MKKFNDEKQYEQTLILFDEYEKKANEIVSFRMLTQAFKACAKLSDLKVGLALYHRYYSSSINDSYLLTSLLQLFMNCDQVTKAEEIFNQSKIRSLSMYATMMKGYIKHQMAEKAVKIFHQISNPNDIVHILFFNSIAQLGNKVSFDLATKIFYQMPKSFEKNPFIFNAAFDMFIKYDDLSNAELVFSKMQKFLIGYGRLMKLSNLQRKPEKTIDLYQQMKNEGIQADLIIYLLLINACSQIGILSTCQRIVQDIPKEYLLDHRISTALIHMWGKSGSIDQAKHLFDKLVQPDAVSYNSIINAYGLNGMALQAIQFFSQMPIKFIDHWTYVSLLNACSHSGLVHQAQTIFDQIPVKTQKIYTVMVDCLSRASLLDQAQKLIEESELSHPPALPMYMALLSGARHQNKWDLSEQIVDRMRKLFPELKRGLTSASILLANVYGSSGQLEKASQIRDQLIQSGEKKFIGISWTEVKGKLWQFRAHDKSHAQSHQIYAELDRLAEELLQNGHEFDPNLITRTMSPTETYQSILCGHSEKLAIAFNLIQTPVPSTIQITKNLRVCSDCHRATKLIARLRQCQIIVRDANRIHHFYTNGHCSCQDYF